MKTKKEPQEAAPQFVVCIDNSGYPASLELHKIYRVLSWSVKERVSDTRNGSGEIQPKNTS